MFDIFFFINDKNSERTIIQNKKNVILILSWNTICFSAAYFHIRFEWKYENYCLKTILIIFHFFFCLFVCFFLFFFDGNMVLKFYFHSTEDCRPSMIRRWNFFCCLCFYHLRFYVVLLAKLSLCLWTTTTKNFYTILFNSVQNA